MPDGTKIVQTITNEKAFYELQEKLSTESNKAPKPIALIPQSNGTVITLYSQIPQQKTKAVQHKNQIIKPLADVITKGIIGYAAVEVVKAVKSDNINVSGENNKVTVDKSERIDVQTNHAEDSSSLTQDSDNDSSTDDHSDNSDNRTDDNSVIDHSDNSDDHSTTDDHSGEITEE